MRSNRCRWQAAPRRHAAVLPARAPRLEQPAARPVAHRDRLARLRLRPPHRLGRGSSTQDRRRGARRDRHHSRGQAHDRYRRPFRRHRSRSERDVPGAPPRLYGAGRNRLRPFRPGRRERVHGHLLPAFCARPGRLSLVPTGARRCRGLVRLAARTDRPRATRPGYSSHARRPRALSLSASFNAALPVQSLASVSLGVAALDVNAGASIRLDAGVTLAGEYKVRLRHTSAGPVEIGLYREKSRDLMVSVSAAAGIAAKVGGFDLAEQFIGALSRQPLVDKEQFRKALAGPDSDAKEQRIENFEASLKAAIDTRLQVSVSAALSRLRSDEAVLLYEVDPSVAAAAVASALAGDWTGLPRPALARRRGAEAEHPEPDRRAQADRDRRNLLGLASMWSRFPPSRRSRGWSAMQRARSPC